MRFAILLPLLAAWALLCLAACDTTEETLMVAVEDVVEGTGETAATGDQLTVHYRGSLRTGKEFLTTCGDANTPFTFTLGEPGLIDGWNRGILGDDQAPTMREAGIRMMTVPSALAWGSRGAGCDENDQNCDVPPNEDVLFLVQLLEVLKPGEASTLPPDVPCAPELTNGPGPF